MNFLQIQYQQLDYAWLLLLTPVLFASFFFLFNARQKKLKAFASSEVLTPLLEKRHTAIYWLKACLLSLVWIAAVFALMGPQGNERYIGSEEARPIATLQKKAVRRRADQVIILIDASSSMQIADTPGGKKRDATAKEIADEILSLLEGENVALYAFTSSIISIVPMTRDYLFTRMMVQQIHNNEGETEGTDFKQALEQMQKLYFATATPLVKSLIVLSDGGDTSLTDLSGESKIAAMDKILQPIENAEREHLYLYAVGIGTKTGAAVPGVTFKGKAIHSSLEEPLMRKLASHGRGAYYSANDTTPIFIARSIVDAIEKQQNYADETAWNLPEQTQRQTLFDTYLYIPLSVALAALALMLILPDTRKRKVLITFWICFLNQINDAQSMAYAQSEHLQADMHIAENLYEAGEFQSAISQYQDLLDYPLPSWEYDLIKYNIGTVLLASTKWNEALLYFQEISDHDMPPLLDANLKRNIALADLQLAKEWVLSLKDNKMNEDASHFEQTNFFFLQFQLDYESAQKAACILSQAIGDIPCQSPEELKEMDHEAAVQFGKFLDALANYHPTHTGKNAPPVQNPEFLLKATIHSQELAKQQSQMEHLSSKQRELKKEASLLKAQQQVLLSADQFISSVVNTQKEQFASPPGPKNRCQRQPWDEVIPLYIEGKNAAERASLMLSQKYFDPVRAQRAQQDALLKWKEALAKLQKPPEKQAASKEQEKKDASTESKNSVSANDASQKEKETLNALQQMEEDDRSAPRNVLNRSGNGKEARPW